jgi:hypothetical protein
VAESPFLHTGIAATSFLTGLFGSTVKDLIVRVVGDKLIKW